MFEGKITFVAVNLFTGKGVMPRTTGVDYKLLAQNPLKARAFGQMKLGNELERES